MVSVLAVYFGSVEFSGEKGQFPILLLSCSCDLGWVTCCHLLQDQPARTVNFLWAFMILNLTLVLQYFCLSVTNPRGVRMVSMGVQVWQQWLGQNIYLLARCIVRTCLQREQIKFGRPFLVPALHHADVDGTIPGKTLKQDMRFALRQWRLALHCFPRGLSGSVQSQFQVLLSLQGSDVMNREFWFLCDLPLLWAQRNVSPDVQMESTGVTSWEWGLWMQAQTFKVVVFFFIFFFLFLLSFTVNLFELFHGTVL